VHACRYRESLEAGLEVILYMSMKLLIGLLALGVTMIAVGLVIVFAGLP